MAFKDQIEVFHPVGSMIGTSVSATFLLLIAAINLVLLVNVYHTFQRVKNGGSLFGDRPQSRCWPMAACSRASSAACSA